MRRDAIDFHEIRPQHLAVHGDLLNWARYVLGGRGRLTQSAPMFRNYRSSEVWGGHEPGIPIDSLAGGKMETAVQKLPDLHCEAIRWHYVYSAKGCSIFRACRAMGVRQDTLNELVHDGRSMLKNRGS